MFRDQIKNTQANSLQKLNGTDQICLGYEDEQFKFKHVINHIEFHDVCIGREDIEDCGLDVVYEFMNKF